MAVLSVGRGETMDSYVEDAAEVAYTTEQKMAGTKPPKALKTILATQNCSNCVFLQDWSGVGASVLVLGSGEAFRDKHHYVCVQEMFTHKIDFDTVDHPEYGKTTANLVIRNPREFVCSEWLEV